MDAGPKEKKAALPPLAELKIKIRPDLYRAFQRCSWIIIHERGGNQVDVMNEMVEDFLRKHVC